MPTIPKVSIIMSVYNAQTYLEEAISSILNQNYSDFEFLIVDDCSTDDSLNIIDLFMKTDQRIQLIQNKSNQGLTKNLNILIRKANGKYIARMDADDISHPDRLKKQVEFLDNDPNTDILGTFSQNISEKGEIIGIRKVPVTNDEIIKLLPKLNPISHPTVMFRSSSLKEIGGYDERFRTSQDFHLWFKAAGHGLRFYNMPKVLFQYRMNDNYIARKSFRYRWNEFKIKLDGYQLIKYPWYKYHTALISLILAFSPSFLFILLKKMDPR
jgi:glycosyltransferase involved in cell wall biosynthesis